MSERDKDSTKVPTVDSRSQPGNTKLPDKRKLPGKSKIPGKRKDPRKTQSQNLILDTAEKLMREEGYAAVSVRRVGKEAGLKPSLIHYHFPTTDDLFVAVFRRAVVQELDKLDEAGAAPDSLLGIWHSYQNSERTALALEFMALANHRKAIRDEIATYTEKARRHRAQVLATLLDTDAITPDFCSTEGLAVLMVGVARTLVLEQGLGISLGHDDANRFVEWWLEKLKKDQP